MKLNFFLASAKGCTNSRGLVLLKKKLNIIIVIPGAAEEWEFLLLKFLEENLSFS